MKTFIVLLCLLLLVPVPAPAQTTYPAASSVTGGDKVRVLQASGENFVTREADVSVLLSGVGTPAQRGQSNTLHVAYRTDGRDGIGSLLDPRDGSTHLKFDTILSNTPQNTIVYLHPSTNYQTRGAAAHGYGETGYFRAIRKFVSLVGIGGSAATQITLRSDATNLWNQKVSLIMFGESNDGYLYDADNVGVRVQGITFDCNAQNNPLTNKAVTGLTIFGQRTVVSDVVVKNLRGFTGSEAFGISLGDGSQTNNLAEYAGGHLVENCHILDNWNDPHRTATWTETTNGSYTSGIGIIHITTNHTKWLQSTIRGCTVAGGGWWAGLSANRYTSVYGNRVVGAVSGFYNDTGDFKNVDVFDNEFLLSSQNGVFIRSTPLTELRVTRNLFTYREREQSMDPSSTAARYTFYFDPGGRTWSNVLVSANSVGFPTNTPSSSYYLYLGVKGSGTINNLLIRDTLIPFTNTFSAAGMTHANNRTHAWGLMATNDVATP